MTFYSNISGWIIDYRTASNVFSSGSNARIDACIEMTSNSRLWIAQCERDIFRQNPQLQPVFANGNSCTIIPNDDIRKRSLALSNKNFPKKILRGNRSAIILSATAASLRYGVLSDHNSNDFLTVVDICKILGIPVLSSANFLDHI